MDSTLAPRPVVLVDIVRSREIDNLRSRRDDRLERASHLHLERGLLERPYAVTAGDEFQSVLKRTVDIPAAVLDLRLVFLPLELRIAVGIGQVEPMPADEPVNVAGLGEAFELARRAMDELHGRHKYRFLTQLRSRFEELDLTVNMLYRLLDTLLQQITARQWETIRAQMETGSQDRTAEVLGVDESTVSRNLSRGYYWQLQETRAALEKLLAGYE